MKRLIIIATLAFALAACTNGAYIEESFVETEQTECFKEFTFSCSGDFFLTIAPITRGSLVVDNKEMTDLWVLDYKGGVLQQQLHQVNTDADFGTPSMTLSTGEHHLYFIISRSTTPTLDTENHKLTFAKVLDTFYKDLSLNVSATSNSNQSVNLDRVVTKLKITFTDEIPTNAATFDITPHTWYYGIDYFTGEPCEASTDGIITVNIPSGSLGKANESVNIFSISSATEWTTDIALNCKTSANVILGQATIQDAPFKRNRVSEYTGPLFGTEPDMTFSFEDWDESYIATW